MKCLNCKSDIDINNKSSTHQVNDNDGETYCSYECSAVATLSHLRSWCNQGGHVDLEDIAQVIENT